MAAEHEGYQHVGIPPACQACKEEAERDQLVVAALHLTLQLQEARASYIELGRERAAVVRDLYYRCGMRQREIGRRLMLSEPRVNQIIHGRKRPD